MSGDVLRYRGPIPLRSDGGKHAPSIWYISDKERYEASVQAIDQLGGFVPLRYCFVPKGGLSFRDGCRYFSVARHDFRYYDMSMFHLDGKNYAFSTSGLRSKMTSKLNKVIEEYHMLCCDYYADSSNGDTRSMQTLIFPTNRGFFYHKNGQIVIVGCYYSIERNETTVLDADGNEVGSYEYSILINGELADGPYAAENGAGFDWLAASIRRNIGEWRKNNGLY